MLGLAMLATPCAAAGLPGFGAAFPATHRAPVPFFDMAAESDDTGSRFLSASADAPYPFVERLGRNPSRICDALDEAGFANLGWKSSVLGNAGECLSLPSEVPEDEAEPNSLFYMLRGRGSPRVDFARLKINLPQPDDSRQTLDRAVDFLRAFSAATRTEPPDAVYAGLKAAEPFSIATRDVSYALKKEYGEPPRYNLSIDFRPTPNAIYWTAELGPYRALGTAAGSLPRGEVVTTAKTSRLVRRLLDADD